MKTVPKVAKTKSLPAAAEKLASFIAKFDPKHQALIRSARKTMRKRLPAPNELVYDNYNFFVIGYGPSERPSEAVFSIAAAANGVGLSFVHGASLPDPHKLLIGPGKQNRFLRFDSADRLSEPEVETLIAAAVAQSKVPFAKNVRGKLIIRSISAKQRPRRK